MLRSLKIVPKIFSRILSSHHLLEVDDHDEEEYSVVLTLGNRLANNLLAQQQSTFFHRWVKFLWMGWQEYVFVVFALAFDRLASRTASRRFLARCCRSPCCCSIPWPTCLSHEKFWPTSENCFCLQIQFWFPRHIYLVGNCLWLPIRAHSNPTFRDRWFSSLGKVYSRQATESVNCENSSMCTKFNHTILLW